MASQYRVELAYAFKNKKAKGGKRAGAMLGMTLTAEDEDAAIDAAIAKHITPFPARVMIQCTAEAEG